METTLAQTPMYAWHADHGARLVDFAGWSMPVQYTSIVTEHQATREAVSVFDVSHMGRLTISGTGISGTAVSAAIDRLVTRQVDNLAPGRIRYSLVTNESGGILDDVLVYRTADDVYQMVVNASNREKIVDWFTQHLNAGVKLVDETTSTAMIALQGPRAMELVNRLTTEKPGDLRYYTFAQMLVAGVDATVSRTGYTGEDGVEIVVPAAAAMTVWNGLFSEGESLGVLAAGLGCRDTLRLEAAMPLYGHELSEDISPIEAGLNFAVSLKDRDFIGRDALVQIKNGPELPQRVGLKLDGRRVPRENFEIYAGDRRVGKVTSGTFSPTFQYPIAMGYVAADVAAIGTCLEIDIRSRRHEATVVELPFYTRQR